ncbi:hypothetical protein MWH25_01435 [Natroniella acetigena]|uniref:hypothetical protein n=1 Tax=Natroniella acetigena TaxID=52004 RepID=UPI00200B5040|nr:hypothetical protein [Natroniella acetigena]MCK8826410.1 hypothetical protein [Natroniella acetigena]
MIDYEFDLFHSRYGWTDEYVKSLDYKIYNRKLAVIIEKEQERKSIQSASAYSLAYLSYYHGATKLSFNKYLEALGLTKSEEVSEEELKKQSEKSINKGKKIIDMFKK